MHPRKVASSGYRFEIFESGFCDLILDYILILLGPNQTILDRAPEVSNPKSNGWIRSRPWWGGIHVKNI